MQHFSIPRSMVEREGFIIHRCRGKRVLHLGFADAPYTDERLANGTWLHEKIQAVSKECVGVDLNAEVVESLLAKGIVNLRVGDAEQLANLELGLFDVIVAGEMIEHLNNPGLFLTGVAKVMSPSSELIITTANAFCARRLSRIPFGKESVHPDHTYYFSHRTLESLATRFGFRLSEAHAYRILNRSPLLPFLFERLACIISPNLGEGIVHVYRHADVKGGA